MFFQANCGFVYLRMEFILSNKGKRKLALNGFLYVCDKSKNGVTYWRCENFRKCRSRVSTAEDDSLMREPTEHSHSPDPACVEVARSKARIRHRAMNSDEAISNIIQRETRDLSFAAAGLLPKIESLQRMVQRKRICQQRNELANELQQMVKRKRICQQRNELANELRVIP